MLRMLFAGVVLLHGVIHTMRFLKSYKLAELSQLQHDIARPVGLLWLLSAVLFIAAAGAFVVNKDWWWFIAAPTLIISQILIILSWSDARFGTIANLIILIPTTVAYGLWSFSRMVDGELQSSFAVPSSEKRIVTQEMIAGVPPVVRRWLERSNIVGKEIAQTVRLKQMGEMRSAPDGKWMKVEADQWFTAEKPGFLWNADVAAAPGISIVGRDKYVDGRGYFLIKVLGLFAAADAKGADIDQGAMLRYLAEISWFPSAALNSYILWREIDSLSAVATMTYGGATASAIFRFERTGDLKAIEAKRYYFRETGSTLEDWLVQVEPDGFREFEGVRVAARLSVRWKFKEGEFTWFRLEITDIWYNQREHFR